MQINIFEPLHAILLYFSYPIIYKQLQTYKARIFTIGSLYGNFLFVVLMQLIPVEIPRLLIETPKKV